MKKIFYKGKNRPSFDWRLLVCVLLLLNFVTTGCAGKTDLDGSNGKDDESFDKEHVDVTENSQNDKLRIEDFAETYWIWQTGIMTGSFYYTVIHENGTMDCVHINDLDAEDVVSVNVSVHDDTLYIDGKPLNIERLSYYRSDDGELESDQRVVRQSAHVSLLLKPDPDQTIKQRIDERNKRQQELKSSPLSSLCTGVWLMYGSQSADVYEYTFLESGKVEVRYRDYMTGNGDYVGTGDSYEYSIDYSKLLIRIQSSDWYYDRDNDLLKSEYYDGPSDSIQTSYLVHYVTMPTTDQIDIDRAKYG